MRPRIPADAFERYVALGASRTYQALADALGISKRTVVRHAIAEGWQDRLVRIERQGLAQAEARLAETAAAVAERHLRVIRAIQGKALQALQAQPLGSGMEAVRALDLAIKAERVILGDAEGPDGAAADGLVVGTWRRGRGRSLSALPRVQYVITGVPASPEDLTAKLLASESAQDDDMPPAGAT